MNGSRRGVLLVVAAMAAFSFMPVFSRFADASVYTVAAWRAVFVAASFGLWTLLREGPAAFRVDRGTLQIAGLMGVALAVASATFVAGYVYTTVANTIFLHNLAPVVVFPLAWWAFRDRPGASVLTGAGVAVAGVGLLSGVSLFQVTHFSSGRFLLGDALAAVSAVGWAGVIVATRAARQRETPLVPTLFYAWTTAAVLLVGVALVADTMAAPPASLAWIFGLALVCTTLPFVLLNLGMRTVPAGLASVLSLTEVVFTTMVGIAVFGEGLSPVGWLGGALAVAGVVYAVRVPEDEPAGADAAGPGRGVRLALGLLGLNLAVVATVLGEGAAAALLAWWSMGRLARFGPGAGAAAFGGSGAGLFRWGAVLLGLLTAVGVAWRAEPGAGSPLLLGVAAGLWWADRRLTAAEPASTQDADPVGGLVLLLAVAGEGFALLDHGAAPIAIGAGRVLVGLAAVRAVAAGVRGPGAPGVGPVGGLVRRLGAGHAALAAVLAWLAGGLHTVPAGHAGIVERFGAPRPDLAPPGLLIGLPPPIDHVEIVDHGRARRLDVLGDSGPILCGDQSLVSLDAVLHYTVSDPLAWAHGVREPEAVLADLARAAVVEVLAGRPSDPVLTDGRSEVESAVAAQVQAAADATGLGVDVRGVALARASVPPAVTAAFLDVISADEERLTRQNIAEAYAVARMPAAGGEAATRLAAAHADAARIRSAAEIDALHVAALARGGSRAPALTRARLGIEAAAARLAPLSVVFLPPGQEVWLYADPAPALAPGAPP